MAAAVVLLSPRAVCSEDATDSRPVAMFEPDIVPILRAYCWKCHGGEGRAAELDMRSLPLLMKGGMSGPAIVRGSADGSRLFQKLAEGQMPPPGEALRPTEAHRATLRHWLDNGAPATYEGGPLSHDELPEITDGDRAWWAFRRPVRPAVPAIRQRDRVRTPIDAFVLQPLERNGLTLSPEADRVMLVRRLCADLIGLPPTPADIDTFVNDSTPNAFEALVDRLLASPHYGERWGRHWLDAAGYVDTIGSDNDAGIIDERERIWKYRDYVVRSFNADKPFDRFLQEQLAGDELVDWRHALHFTPEIEEALIATGFLRQAADVTYAPELNTADIRHQVLYDTVQIVAGNLIGLTVHCAQCHSHKFDPVSQADYYRLAAFFTPAYDVQNWKHPKERFLPDVSETNKQSIDQHNAEVDRQIADLRAQIAAIRVPFEQRVFESKLAVLPEAIRADTKIAVQTPADKRSEIQKYLVEKFEAQLKVTPAEVDQALDDDARAKSAKLNEPIAGLEASRRSYGRIQALWDVGPPPPAYLYRRGDYQTPGAELTAGVPTVLDDPAQPFQLPVPGPEDESSGYRTALARWLTRPDHPLTARVFVNRVWQQFFGRGIVATPDNFGASGALPSHPELLDWLATEFVRRAWSVKHLLRLIVTSSVYRQSSAPDTDSAGPDVDPENVLLWRMPLRRLDSEAVRDAILTVSGDLEQTMGGPPVPLKPNPDGSVEIDTTKLPAPGDQYRRSLYLFCRRNYQLTELSVFDQPVVAHNCTRRMNTAVVLQSLTLLNGPFVFAAAERFAERVKQSAGADESKRIETAFRLALGRLPGPEEAAAGLELLARQAAAYQNQNGTPLDQAADAALANLCQMLLNTNEFLYIP
jgi:cytochrome c553